MIAGIAEGCREARCALIGGESAEMPDHYRPGDYDLAGFAVGAVERAWRLPRADIAAGDVLLGLASSGVHANGFSLVRKILREQRAGPARIRRRSRPTQSLASALLVPTRIYVRSLLSLLGHTDVVKAMAHITGGGLIDNLPRVLPDGVVARIDASSWRAPPVFLWLYEAGRLRPEEMLRTFNCGIGMVLVVVADYADATIDWLSERGETVSLSRRADPGRGACARPDRRHGRLDGGTTAHGRPDLGARLQPAGPDRGVARSPDASAEIVLVISNRADAAGLAPRQRMPASPTEMIPHGAFATQVGFENAIDRTPARARHRRWCAWPASCACSAPGSSSAGAIACSTSIPRCCRRSAGWTRIAACSRQACASPAARCIWCAPRSMPARSSSRPWCRCSRTTTPTSLAARVLDAEHRCYPMALELVASGRARVIDERVMIDGATTADAVLLNPADI